MSVATSHSLEEMHYIIDIYLIWLRLATKIISDRPKEEAALNALLTVWSWQLPSRPIKINKVVPIWRASGRYTSVGYTLTSSTSSGWTIRLNTVRRPCSWLVLLEWSSISINIGLSLILPCRGDDLSSRYRFLLEMIATRQGSVDCHDQCCSEKDKSQC